MAARRNEPVSRAGKVRLVAAALAVFAALVGMYGVGTSRGSGATGWAAGDKVIASCGLGMRVTYRTAFDESDGRYAVSGIELSHIPAGCQSQSASATFYDGSGAPIGSTVEATLPSAGSTQSIPILPSSNDIDAGHVNAIAVVVS
jgi:hypothetical protein